MAEPHNVLEILRRARPDIPDELVSAGDPAAQALLEEILSMPDTATPDVADHAPVSLTRSRRHRRRIAVGSAAAAAVAALLAAGVLVLAPTRSTEASPLAAAAEKTTAALRQSGRADATIAIDYTNGEHEEGTEHWEFSGADTSTVLDYGDAPGSGQIQTFVGGEWYFYRPTYDNPTWRWMHLSDPPEGGSLAVDPATVLGELRSAGDFEEVGHEPVDGVDTVRLQSTDPSQLPRFSLGYGLNESMLGPITSLEVWVDGDEMVRQFEVTFGGIDSSDVLAVSGAVVTIRFFDFGAPITIEAPAEYEERTDFGAPLIEAPAE
jgi:hypothetical protein